jgi:membrane protease YdiL (CAAX protease family)
VALAAVVLAPLAEELMFRVVIQGWLESREKPAAAITTTALLFSVIHGLPDAIGLFPLALILGYVYRRTHSYLAVVVLHGLFNAFNLSMVLLARPEQAVEKLTTKCVPDPLTAALQWASSTTSAIVAPW